jgi:class 3 adenylate cyclase
MPFRRVFPPHACLDRLEALIRARLAPDADKAAVDASLWREFGDTAAVMFTDLTGFSRGVAAFGITHFLQIIHESARLLVPCIDAAEGKLLKSEGDSMLVTFATPRTALDAAMAMQQAAAEYNRHTPAEEQVLLCVGLGFGRVLRIGDADVFGAEVNAASKLGEDIAKAGEILVTENFRAGLGEVPGARFSPLEVVPPGASAAWRVEFTTPPTPTSGG